MEVLWQEKGSFIYTNLEKENDIGEAISDSLPTLLQRVLPMQGVVLANACSSGYGKRIAVSQNKQGHNWTGNEAESPQGKNIWKLRRLHR